MSRARHSSTPAADRRSPRWTGKAALFLLVVAALRVGFLMVTRSDPVFRAPDLDEAFYHVWGRSLAEGRGDFQGPYFLGALYPYVLSVVYRIFGPDVLAVRVVQTVLGIFDIGLVLLLGRRLFGPGAGFLAAALLALYGPLVFYEGLLLVEVLILTLALGAVVVLIVPGWNPVVRGSLAGLFIGLAALGRATALLCLPIALLALYAERPRSFKRSAPAVLGCIVCCIAVLVPVIVRNHRLGGGIAITTNGGVNFYAGNFAGATGRFREPPGVQFFRVPALPTANPRAPLPPRVAADALTVRAAAGTERAAESGMWFQLGWNWIRTHPKDFLLLEARKAWLLVQEQEVTHLESFAFQRRRLAPLRVFVVGFSWILPLAVLGMWRARRERIRDAGVLAAFVAVLLVPSLLFFVTARYRLAAVPGLAVFAGFGAVTLIAWLRARAWREVAWAAVALGVLVAIARSAGGPPAGELAWQNAQMAYRFAVLGDLDAAIQSQEDAARLLPEDARLRVELARYRSERGAPGDLERAEALLRDAVSRLPDRPDAPFLLGVVLVRQGRVEEARAAWQHALQIDPGYAPAQARLRDAASHP